MNHLYTFLLFFAASVFVYKIGGKLGLGYKYSVLLVLLFIICPRILADSFYNIKDSVFLSLFTIMIYYGLAVMSEFKVKNAAGLAVSAAFCLNTRIVGALPLFILCIAYLFKDGKFESKRFLHIFMTGVISFGLYILISPAAWSDPAGYIHNTVSVFSNYEANSGTITLGKSVYAYEKLPWYYTILCIWLTMPGFYLIFCVAGIVSVVKQICTGNKKINLTRNILVITLLVQFSVVMIYDAVMKPIKYNMWRHFYFIFLFIVIFAVIGIRNLADSAGKYRSVITAWAGFAVMLTVIWNVRNHPYEFAYYNPLFATDTEDNMRHDYWGVSDHDLLKRVDDNDINVYPRSSVSMFFGEEGWERFHAGSEQYCAEYKFERTDMKGAERWEILYKEEEVTEVDGRRVSAISKRINYDNCLFKYVVDGKGVRGGVLENHRSGIKWEYSVQETDRVIVAEIPGEYSVSEMDFLVSQNQNVCNVRAYSSPDGKHWKGYDENKNIFVGESMFSVITEKPLSRYFMMKYELMEGMESEPEIMIRVYGHLKDEIILRSGVNSDLSEIAMDENTGTVWTSGAPQRAGMTIDLQMRRQKRVKGIEIISGLRDYSRELVIQYKDLKGDYKNISYMTDDNTTYIFCEPVVCSEIRLINNADQEKVWWTIYELRLETEEVYFKTYKNTKDTIENICSSHNNELVGNMLDNAPDSKWSAGGSRNHDMYIDLKLKPQSRIAGFYLDAGRDVFESARQIKLYGSHDGSSWENIDYHYGSANDYVFENESDYQFYRIHQTGNDDQYTWSVAELRLLKTK